LQIFFVKFARVRYSSRHMAGLVKIEETSELPHPRAVVWPILARTDWLNRAIGLPPVKYTVEPLPEGGSKVTARAKILGLPLAWREFPFEWTEPEFYQVRRVFAAGALVESVMGLRLRETKTGCAIESFGHFKTRNLFGTALVRHVVGPKTMRDLRALIRHVGEHLAGQQPTVMPNLPRAAANLAALDGGLNQMRAEKLSEPLLEKLRGLLVSAADVELSHIRPFNVAKRWRADRWEVLKIFLHATRAGLLNLRWEVLCPNCRSTRLPRTASLAELAQTAHCDVCNIRFDAEFDKSVELKFSVHPSVRPCDEQTFCLVGPGARPHIAAQIHLEPEERREWPLPVTAWELRVRSVQVKAAAALPAHGVEVVCAPEKFEFKNTGTTFFVRNPNPFPVQVALESGAGDDEILTAARVTNWQEFRDLFATEVISPNERVTVGSQVVLFTDLRGSTALYSAVGDAPAYALVRDHFKILHDVISAHHGGVVKTIGDAVMAVFSDLGEALNAARQMHAELARVDSKKIRLRLKCALHAGPCLAVNANDRLDFFGSVVNLAARLVEKSQGDDLVVADEIFQRPETKDFLRTLQQNAVADKVEFNGIPEPVRIWRIALPAA
jgi:class 3 adenylate cyclase